MNLHTKHGTLQHIATLHTKPRHGKKFEPSGVHFAAMAAIMIQMAHFVDRWGGCEPDAPLMMPASLDLVDGDSGWKRKKRVFKNTNKSTTFHKR